MVLHDAWRYEAACAGLDTDKFFPDTATEYRQVRKICFRCPVQAECLIDALSTGTFSAFGIRGGLTPAQRNTIIRRRRARLPKPAAPSPRDVGIPRNEAVEIVKHWPSLAS